MPGIICEKVYPRSSHGPIGTPEEQRGQPSILRPAHSSNSSRSTEQPVTTMDADDLTATMAGMTVDASSDALSPPVLAPGASCSGAFDQRLKIAEAHL